MSGIAGYLWSAKIISRLENSGYSRGCLLNGGGWNPRTMSAQMAWLRTVRDAIPFMALYFRSRTSLAPENLFLRKQLAFYEERKVRPRRADNPNPPRHGLTRSAVRLAKRLDGGEA